MSTPKNKNGWNLENLEDQRGRVAIVTGSNSGIGFETAKALAGKGAHVVMACRNMEKAEPKAEVIRSFYPDAKVEVMRLDLSDLERVKDFSDVFHSRFERLDLLINNAGVMVPPYSKTAQGFELQFGVNHLGHFALTGRLLDVLLDTPDSRVVNVSSMAHKGGRIQFDDLNFEKKYKSWAAYGQSKLANLLFTYELQRKLDDAGATTKVLASHPGWTATELQKNVGIADFMNQFLAQEAPQGALPTLRAAVEEPVQGAEYFGPSGFMEIKGLPTQVDSNARSKDEAVADKLWQVSEELTGVHFPL